MEKFKKKLTDIAGVRPAYIIAILAIAVALAVSGIILNNKPYEPFDAMSDGPASLGAVYVMGPFAEKTDGEGTSKEFFIAQAADEMWYVLATEPNTSLPIYGVDISEDDIAALPVQGVNGIGEQIPSELVPYLVEFFIGSDPVITETNYPDYLGTHYLDTTLKASNAWDILYIAAAMVAALGLLPCLGSNKQRKQVKQRLDELEASGQLKPIYDDFNTGDPIYSLRLRLAASHHYLLDVGASDVGLRVIRLSEIDRVFLYKMIEGQPTVTNFIALENEEQQYVVAQSPNKTKQFNLILERLKTDVEKEKLLK